VPAGDEKDSDLVMHGVKPSHAGKDRLTRSRQQKESLNDGKRQVENDGPAVHNNNESQPTKKNYVAPHPVVEEPKEKYVILCFLQSTLILTVFLTLCRYISTRKFFGADEDVYIMDAKEEGNLGRYLNHSCEPNCFVQNCFVDTHDLRFPWVAFFAMQYIKVNLKLLHLR